MDILGRGNMRQPQQLKVIGGKQKLDVLEEVPE